MIHLFFLLQTLEVKSFPAPDLQQCPDVQPESAKNKSSPKVFLEDIQQL
jgi:hypothetical protein